MTLALDEEQPLLVHAGQLITARGDEVLRDATIVVRGGRIEDVIRDGQVPEFGQRLDASDATVLPGLIDAHVHLALPFSPYDAAGEQAATTEVTVARAAFMAIGNARRVLERGVTTVRDLGSHGATVFALQRAIAADELDGPRIIASGPAISPTGGHFPLGSLIADGPSEIRRTARSLISSGAGVLKVMASAGGVTPGRGAFAVLLSEDEIMAAVNSGRGRGVRVAAHAVNPESAANAIRAGASSIEHGVLIDLDTVNLMRDHGTVFVPTLWVYRRTAKFGERFRSLGPALLNELQDRLRHHADVVRMANGSGVPVVAGSDAGTPYMPANALTWEIEWLAAAGLRSIDAIRAATDRAAGLLGVADVVGSIEPGKAADLLVVNGDPLTKLSDLRRVRTVIQGGRVLVRDGKTSLSGEISDPHPFPDGPLPEPPSSNARDTDAR